MTDEAPVKLMKVLGGYKSRPETLYVGGCVRNMLLDRPVRDIDLATVHHPLKVIEKLKAGGIRYVPSGLDHGTLTAIIDDSTFEITTLRKDIETDGRFAVIAFTDEWEIDARRRDFTINTLFCSPEGEVFDPTGAGLDDLEARRVIFVGDPAERLAEDYLRILRFFRFHAEYGEGAADEKALAACKEYAAKVALLSRERIMQEFLKIIAVSKAHDILSLMFAHDVLTDIGRDYSPAVMEHLCNLQTRHDAVDLMARYFVLTGGSGDFFEDRLIFSNVQKKQVRLLLDSLPLLSGINMKKIREIVYRFGNGGALQTYFVKLAQKGQAPDLEILDIARYWQAPEFPVKAEQLIAAGVSRGPDLGMKLKELEEKWIAKDFPADFSY
ncbi:MAG: CCA tRNA nucleotidyltransferase [Micavibrio sp.]